MSTFASFGASFRNGLGNSAPWLAVSAAPWAGDESKKPCWG
jgi:hypothetical protein